MRFPRFNASWISTPILIIAFLAIWHLYVVVFKVPPAVLPRPDAVLASLIQNWRLILAEGWITVTPLQFNLTQTSLLQDMAGWSWPRIRAQRSGS